MKTNTGRADARWIDRSRPYLRLTPPPRTPQVDALVLGLAETFDSKALEVARELRDDEKIERIAARRSELMRKHGRLEEALAEASLLRRSRSTHIVRFEILASAGRFAEALVEMEAAAGTDPMRLARHETLIQA